MKYIALFLRIGLWSSLTIVCGATVILASMFLYLAPGLPSVDSLRSVQLQVPLRVYTSDGKLMSEYGDHRRKPINIDDVPQQYVDALLAIEDEHFLEHHGVSLKGLSRAVFELILSGKRRSGGSTITMQVARNFYLSRDKTFKRKFTEILLALHIDRELTKREILELYVNKVFLGQRAYGIESAAQIYYGKSINDLSLAQVAMIAGLPQAPSAANPISNPKRALKRRGLVLKRMLELGKITQGEYQEALASPLTARLHGSKIEVYAPYVSEMVRIELEERFGDAIYSEGFTAYTTVDSKLQIAANEAVQRGLSNYEQKHGFKGPEKSYPLSETLVELFEGRVTSLTELSAEQQSRLYSFWLDKLKPIPTYGLLNPALVTSINDQEKSLTMLLKDGEEIQVAWEGLQWAHEYINVDKQGPKPKQPSEIVAIGDLVRAIDVKGQWQMTQVPAKVQSAFVSLSPDDGAIKALVGGFNYRRSKFNRVTQAMRQPGSSFKPFVYASALHHGYTTATTINDAPIVLPRGDTTKLWRPTNSSKTFSGPMRMREALYRSRNLVSIRLLSEIGIGKTIRYIGRFGFESDKFRRDLSLALGSSEVTPLQLATAYAIFANGGYKVNSYFISKIIDGNGEVIFNERPATVCKTCQQMAATNQSDLSIEDMEDSLSLSSEAAPESSTQGSGVFDEFGDELPRAERVIEPEVAYLINSMLKDVIQKGTATLAKSLDRKDIGGKTGTTNDQVDAWFSGFNGDYVATTWVGFDQPATLGRKAYGGAAALPIWIDYMSVALEDKPYHMMEEPFGMVRVKIDPQTGFQAAPGQESSIFEVFRKDKVPASIVDDVESNTIAVDDDGEEITPEQIF